MNIQHLKDRSHIVRLIRRFLDERGFSEMHTPRLVGLPGQEPYLYPFWTDVLEENGSVHSAALVTSPEYSLKRLLAEGLDNIYDLGPCFRNREPWDGSHDPEFLLLEWYRRDAELKDLMRDTEDMIQWVAKEFGSNHPKNAELQNPFRRLTVAQAMKQYAGIDLDALLDHPEKLPEIVRAHGQTVTESDSFDDLFFKIFLSEVEPNIGWNKEHTLFQPTFLCYYPASMAALARKQKNDPRYALRVELYIGDLEMANGFAELADPEEQRERFLEERKWRSSRGEKIWPLDERFLSALPKMGDAAGIAFGVERLVMLLLGVSSINDILPFPARERFNPEPEKNKIE